MLIIWLSTGPQGLTRSFRSINCS